MRVISDLCFFCKPCRPSTSEGTPPFPPHSPHWETDAETHGIHLASARARIQILTNKRELCSGGRGLAWSVMPWWEGLSPGAILHPLPLLCYSVLRYVWCVTALSLWRKAKMAYSKFCWAWWKLILQLMWSGLHWQQPETMTEKVNY